MKKFILILLAAFMLILNSQQNNYKKVKIFTNGYERISELHSLGIDLDHYSFEKDGSITVFLSDAEFGKLQNSNFQTEVLIDDWKNYYANLPKMSDAEIKSALLESKNKFNIEGFDYGSMGGYYTYTEIQQKLDEMYNDYPNLITEKFSIGTTIEGRTIWAVKISDNPNVSENEPQVYFDGLVHAREPQSMATLMYAMFYMLENYGADPQVTYLLDNREIFIVPCFNPDGYEYNRSTNPSGGGMWRKNRSFNGGAYGVDLNRNFGYQWGYDNVGSSPTPSSETYRGPSAFSELETQAVRDFVLANDFKTYVNFHSYGNVIMYPWGYVNQLTPDSATFTRFAQDMNVWNGYDYGTGGQTIGYNSNGNIRDWMYGEQTAKDKIFGYVFEIGSSSDGFWPSQSRILPLAQENLNPILYLISVAGEYLKYDGSIFSQQYFNPGDSFQMTPIISNSGLADAQNVTLELQAVSSEITVASGNLSIGVIAAGTKDTASASFSLEVGAAAVIGEAQQVLLSYLNNGTVVKQDTIDLIIGTPVLLFEDDDSDPTIKWDVSATPVTPKWESTTLTYNSSPASYADSKNGEYANNATVSLTLKDPVDLSGVNSAFLTYYTKFYIEDNWDCGQVRISTNNGVTWTALEGIYTVPGSGQGRQPNGQPVYEGTMANWNREEIDLSGFADQQIKIQFVLMSDVTITEDGWFLDDITISYYGAVPVELTSFNTSTVENGVMLEWRTATELNNSGFRIERSSVNYSATNPVIPSGGEGWETIGTIAGKGTTTDPQSYSFIDESPIIGTAKYRLVQIDFDGTTRTYPAIEHGYFKDLTFSLEQNYPNPFNPTTKIKFVIPTINAPLSGGVGGGLVNLKVFDILAREVATLLNKPMPAGIHEVEFNASDLPSGVYFYNLNYNGTTLSRKMMLIK